MQSYATLSVKLRARMFMFILHRVLLRVKIFALFYVSQGCGSFSNEHVSPIARDGWVVFCFEVSPPRVVSGRSKRRRERPQWKVFLLRLICLSFLLGLFACLKPAQSCSSFGDLLAFCEDIFLDAGSLLWLFFAPLMHGDLSGSYGSSAFWSLTGFCGDSF